MRVVSVTIASRRAARPVAGKRLGQGGLKASVAAGTLIVGSLVSGPLAAEPLNADAAQRFVVGRTFSYSCYEGTVGSGKVMKDGSVAGTIQVRGTGVPRYVTLPAGTVLAKGESVCAKLKGVAFQPCFELEKTATDSFRGNLAGFERMWCEFKKGGAGRTRLAERGRAPGSEVAHDVAAAAPTASVTTARIDDAH